MAEENTTISIDQKPTPEKNKPNIVMIILAAILVIGAGFSIWYAWKTIKGSNNSINTKQIGGSVTKTTTPSITPTEIDTSLKDLDTASNSANTDDLNTDDLSDKNVGL